MDNILFYFYAFLAWMGVAVIVGACFHNDYGTGAIGLVMLVLGSSEMDKQNSRWD